MRRPEVSRVGGPQIGYTDRPPLSRRLNDMIPMRTRTLFALAMCMLLAGACASSPMRNDSGTVSLRCPSGSTMICEADTIGRMRHGTFANNDKKCGCVPESSRGLESPSIPSIH